MIAFLIINSLMTLFVLGAVKALASAPARHRLWLCLAATLLWLLPVQELAIVTPLAEASPLSGERVREVAGILITPRAELGPQSGFFPSGQTLFWLALGLGLGWFLLDLLRQARLISRWRGRARAVSDPRCSFSEGKARGVRVFEVPGEAMAVTTGLLRPRIWIGERLYRSEARASVLAHERTHVRCRDNLWLLLSHLVKRLFWWHPLPWFLHAKLRRLVELRCDEICRDSFPEGEYRSHLAACILERATGPEAALSASMVHDSKFSLQRLQFLERRFSMKPFHILILALLTCFSLLLFAISPKGDQGSATPASRHRGGANLPAILENLANREDVSFFLFSSAPPPTIHGEVSGVGWQGALRGQLADAGWGITESEGVYFVGANEDLEALDTERLPFRLSFQIAWEREGVVDQVEYRYLAHTNSLFQTAHQDWQLRVLPMMFYEPTLDGLGKDEATGITLKVQILQDGKVVSQPTVTTRFGHGASIKTGRRQASGGLGPNGKPSPATVSFHFKPERLDDC